MHAIAPPAADPSLADLVLELVVDPPWIHPSATSAVVIRDLVDRWRRPAWSCGRSAGDRMRRRPAGPTRRARPDATRRLELDATARRRVAGDGPEHRRRSPAVLRSAPPGSWCWPTASVLATTPPLAGGRALRGARWAPLWGAVDRGPSGPSAERRLIPRAEPRGRLITSSTTAPPHSRDPAPRC